jgi:diacylglycerol kinase family enzyme
MHHARRRSSCQVPRGQWLSATLPLLEPERDLAAGWSLGDLPADRCGVVHLVGSCEHDLVRIDELRPAASRRLAAIGSMLAVVVTVATAVWWALGSLTLVFVVIALIAVFLVALWVALTRATAPRAMASVIVIVAAAGIVGVLISDHPLRVIATVLVLAAADILGRYALARDVRTLKRSPTWGEAATPARHGVLIMNPRSGGGKVERFHLVAQCRQRGVEPVVLEPGDDLRRIARDAIERGADVIGMAGGDGSQALVASVAATCGVPLVVVPAGTRNHLALDLGIDRDDVVGALDAFGEAVERPMDLGEVNGRVFVNNVSLGLYATIVRSPEYRDAKVNTTLAELPKMLGPGTQPMDLRYVDPAGIHHDSAHLIQVSNGPYGRTLRTMESRGSVQTGVLGVNTLIIPDDAAATRFIAAISAGHPEHFSGLQSWTTTSFAVGSGAPVPVGLDGEALQLEPPLCFTIHPKAVRVRLASGAIGYSPAAREVTPRNVLPDLMRVARGKTVAIRTRRGSKPSTRTCREAHKT